MKPVFLFIAFFSLPSPGESLNKPSSLMKGLHNEAKKSQQKINRLDDETKRLIQRYRRILNKTENLKIYNQRLASYIEGQKREALEMRKKIEQVKDTGREIEPLMLRMFDSLQSFISLDVPFLFVERKKRIQKLKETLGRSDVSLSEKYRQLIAAYKVEQDYGRTLGSYRGVERIEGRELAVDYIRLGRLSFAYKSLDGKHRAYWDKSAREWRELSGSYKRDLAKAVKIALKQIPPDLVRLPVSAAPAEGN